MKYLLIDNCTLLQLIDENGYNNYLSDLANLINTEEVALIIHQIVIDEWEKHKTERKNKLERKLLFYERNSRKIKSDNLLPSIPFVNISYIEKQISEIDRLILNAQIIVQSTEGIKNEVADRIQKRLAPFHNKLDSVSDWEILAGVCNYCELYGIKELYFLSHNHNDFADLVEISRKINPDFQDRFKKVKINYFKNYSDFFKSLATGLSTYAKYQIARNEKFSHKTAIRKTDLDSLYYLYNELYDEINFIPNHILRKFYPFSISENSNVYYSAFTFHYVNDSLVSFFDNVIIQDGKEIGFKDEAIVGKIKDYKSKTAYVLKRLTENLVFNLIGDKAKKEVNIHYYIPKINCDCVTCTFNRFEFGKTFKQLKNNSSDLKDKLKTAYINYQLGNYLSLNKLYDEIIEEAYIKNKYIIYFIAKYNKRNLGYFLRNFYTPPTDEKLIQDLLNIDPLEEAVKLKSQTDYNLLSFIASQDFFYDAYQNISDHKNKILEHYFSQLNGGWSTNQHVWNLITEFVNLETFLNSNNILFDNYSNFENLFELVAESLFASHAISEKQSSRLAHFDDYWVSKFIIYGKRDYLIRYFNRFKLKELKYKSTDTDNTSITVLLRNLFNSERSINEDKAHFLDHNNSLFLYKYNRLLENALVMISLLDLNQDIINECASMLLYFLSTQKMFQNSGYGSIKLLLQYKGKKLSNDILYRFLSHFIRNDSPNQIDILEALLDNFNTQNIEGISDDDFNWILAASKNKSHGGILAQNLIIKIFEIVNEDKKSKISETAQSNIDEHFSFELYYLYTMHNIIALDQSKLLNWIDEFEVPTKNNLYRPFFINKEEYQIGYVDKLLNLCFKYNIDTSIKEIQKLKQIHPYYNWLINMDIFDYSKFDPEWVLNYQTSYYVKRMSKSYPLKQALISFLRHNNHYRIERLLIKITYFIDK